jgi:hypothetical protein
MERDLAIYERRDKFIWDCGFHGQTSHDTKTGVCELCFIANAHLEPKARALITGAIIYTDVCHIHGPGDFHGKGKRCARCYSSTGRKRGGPGAPLSDGARAVARRAGEKTYLAACEIHGETAHSVTMAKCLTCFSTSGARRQFARVPV